MADTTPDLEGAITAAQLDQLVNGNGEGALFRWKSHDRWKDLEYGIWPRKRSWFWRCCGTRMWILSKKCRRRDADKFPTGSRGARAWYDILRAGLYCEKCRYTQALNAHSSELT